MLFKLIVKSAFSVVKINSEEFNDLLDRFTMAFHIIKGIKFTVVTKLKVNTLVQKTKIVDVCLDLNITYTSSDNGIAYMKLHNFTRNTKCILTLELSTGVIHDDHMHTTLNCTNEQLYILFSMCMHARPHKEPQDEAIASDHNHRINVNVYKAMYIEQSVTFYI